MITRAKLSTQFADVKGTLDQALASGGGRLQFPSRTAATQYLHRCNVFRKKWREADLTASLYDLLVLRRATDDGVLVFDKREPAPDFIPNNEGPVAVPAEAADDELMDAALAAAQNIGIIDVD